MDADTTADKQNIEFDGLAAGYRELVDENVQVTGENSEYFAEYKAKYISRKFGRTLVSTRILDYGCGVGLLARKLKTHLPQMQVDGFDVSAKSIERVDADLRRQGLFTSQPEALGSDYGLVVLANVLHHVDVPHRQSVIEDAISRLAPGGVIVIFEHNPLNPLTRWAVSRCPFDEGVVLLRSHQVRSLIAKKIRSPKTDYIVFFPRWLKWCRQLEPLLCSCPAGAQHATSARVPQVRQ